MTAVYLNEADYQPRTASHSRAAAAGLWVIFFSLIFLQRFAIGGVPVSFAISYVVLIAFILLRVLIIDRSFLIFFFVALAITSIPFLSWGSETSLSSFAYMLAIYAIYMLRFRNRERSFSLAQHIFLKLMWFAAIAGIAQFAAQFALGFEAVFPLERLPEGMLLSNFNVIIPLSYGSTIVKSNGIFFLEPSFFSQFLALALILELLGRQRTIYVATFLVALLLSYSGTGILLAALFLPFVFLRRINPPLIFGSLLVGIIIVVSMGTLEFNTLFQRVGEFNTPQSSGFARFVSPFYLIRDFLMPAPTSFLFGMGPGTIDAALTKATSRAYLAHDPTWIKVIYEYGLVGGLAVMSYVIAATHVGARSRLFALALTFTWLVLGGYLLNGMMNVLFVCLGALHGLPPAPKRRKALRPREARPIDTDFRDLRRGGFRPANARARGSSPDDGGPRDFDSREARPGEFRPRTSGPGDFRAERP